MICKFYSKYEKGTKINSGILGTYEHKSLASPQNQRLESPTIVMKSSAMKIYKKQIIESILSSHLIQCHEVKMHQGVFFSNPVELD